MAEKSEGKEQFVASARASFVTSNRQPCKVCGKYKSLTHAHHIVPLAIQARYRSEPNHDHVWLCPTHHTAVHLLIGQADSTSDRASRSCISVVNDLSDGGLEELRAVMQIAEAAWE